MRWRVVLSVLALGLMSARFADANEVRVLLHESADPIRIETASGDAQPGSVQLRLDTDGGLLAVADDGIEVIGHAGVWSGQGPGPWRLSLGAAARLGAPPAAAGPDRLVRGRLEAWSDEGRIYLLNRVDLEHYVGSTVGGEMIPSWPIEALRAQAVAARTYVLHEAAKRQSHSWDVRATELSQVYKGLGAETPRTISATRTTEGEILVHEGEPILAVFHSTAGGRTAGAGEVWGRDLPYLQAVEVEGEDDAPFTYWRAPKGRRDLEMHARSLGFRVGQLHDIEVASRTPSGRVERLELAGSGGQATISGVSLRQFAATLGLRSTLFEIRPTESGFAFVGSGYGHGVGMSQWGARGMAIRGATYREILSTFYPGAHLGSAGRSAQSLGEPFSPEGIAQASGGPSGMDRAALDPESELELAQADSPLRGDQ